jgi:nucleotide-binding universal stress UspA family protein
MRSRHILVGYSGSSAAAAALEWSAHVAQASLGRLTIALVLETNWLAGCACGTPFGDAALTMRHPNAVAQFRRAVAGLPLDVPVTTVVTPGRAARVLAALAAQHGCDTIVIGANRSHWLKSFGIGDSLRRLSDVDVVEIARTAEALPGIDHPRGGRGAPAGEA